MGDVGGGGGRGGSGGEEGGRQGWFFLAQKATSNKCSVSVYVCPLFLGNIRLVLPFFFLPGDLKDFLLGYLKDIPEEVDQ